MTDIKQFATLFRPFIEKVFRSHGFEANYLDTHYQEKSAEISFAPEAPTGQFGFMAKEVECSAMFDLPENGTWQWLAYASLRISYKVNGGGHNGNRVEYAFVFEYQKGRLEELGCVRVNDLNKINNAVYQVNREKKH